MIPPARCGPDHAGHWHAGAGAQPSRFGDDDPQEPAPYTLMGVLNVTPDSFSDGGRFLDPEAAIRHGFELEEQGAAILDVGGESTRPGAGSVAAHEQLRRVLPVLEGLQQRGASAQVSIDTTNASVAAAALREGATLVNDVTALRGDPAMAELVASRGVHCCLVHMLGTPPTMQDDPHYGDVVADVKAFLEQRMVFATGAGIAEDRLLLDPGIGFGKTTEHNLELLRRLDEIVALGRPVVIGTSRKGFLGDITGRAVDDRLAATVASNVLAFLRGACVFRVHDVGAVRDGLEVAAATVTAPWPTPTITTR